MMCDLLVSTEDTRFYYPEARLGTTTTTTTATTTTGGGIGSLAARMVPHHLAMEIMLPGSKIPAQRSAPAMWGSSTALSRMDSMNKRRWRSSY